MTLDKNADYSYAAERERKKQKKTPNETQNRSSLFQSLVGWCGGSGVVVVCVRNEILGKIQFRLR